MKRLDIQHWAEIHDQLKALAQATGHWNDPNVQQLIALAVQRQNEPRIKFLLKRFERELARDDSGFHPFLPGPDPEDLSIGDIRLGSLETSEPVFMHHNNLLFNMLFVGPPGKGKSVLVTQVVEQLLRQSIPVHIFDTQGEYPDVLEPQFPDLECIDVRDCRVNPFVGPAGMSHKNWILGEMCNYLREALWWRDRTIELFRTISLDLLEQVDVITPPLFAEAFDRIPISKKNTPESGSLQRFATMIRTLETFQCLEGESIEDLRRKPRVYDLWSVSKDVREFFVSHMVTLHKASRRFKRDRELEIVFVFDELSQFITKEALAKKADAGEGFFLELLRTGRKMGIGCILADQTYSLIHQVPRTNCQTKVVLQTSDGPSRREVCRDFGLTFEQRDYLAVLSFQQAHRRALTQLETYPKPFLLTIDEYKKPEPLTQEEINARRAAVIDDMTWEPIPEGKKKPDPDFEVLTPKMLRILKTIVFDCFATQQEHARKMGIAESTFSKHAHRLKEQGLIRDVSIHKGTRGGKIKILVPTKQGYEYLDKSKIKYKPIPGSGTITHRFWQHKILNKVKRKGDVGGIEYSLIKKRVDVGIINLHGKTAYEVVNEGPLQKEISNLRKNLDEGWDHVIFCVENEETRQALASLVDDELGDADDRVEIQLLRKFA